MLTQAMQDIINFIKAVAPIVWETLVKQVYVDAVTYFIWGIVLAVTAVILLKLSKGWLVKANEGNDEIYGAGAVFGYIFGVVLPFISVALITTGIRFMINPYYYAVLNIIKMFTASK